MTDTLACRELPRPANPAGPDLRLPAYRAQILLWLAGLFAQAPSPRDVAAYRHGPAGVWLTLLGRVDALADGLGAMRAVLEAKGSDDGIAAQLGHAHARLFAGVSGRTTVSPYESAYGETRRLFQKPAAEMAELLRRHDLHVAQDYAEAPDHLCVELALLARLLETGSDDATDLVRRLNGWVPRFAELCQARDPSGFWAGAARLLTDLLALETPASRAFESSLHPQTGGHYDRHCQA
jgi:TorA-specific chaperone